MSKVFLCLALLFSAFMLLVAVTGSSPARPTGMIFWSIIGATSTYKLLKSPAKA